MLPVNGATTVFRGGGGGAKKLFLLSLRSTETLVIKKQPLWQDSIVLFSFNLNDQQYCGMHFFFFFFFFFFVFSSFNYFGYVLIGNMSMRIKQA